MEEVGDHVGDVLQAARAHAVDLTASGPATVHITADLADRGSHLLAVLHRGTLDHRSGAAFPVIKGKVRP